MENCASHSLSSTNPGNVEESHEIQQPLQPFESLFVSPQSQLAPLAKRHPQLHLLHSHKYQTHHKRDCIMQPSSAN